MGHIKTMAAKANAGSLKIQELTIAVTRRMLSTGRNLLTLAA